MQHEQFQELLSRLVERSGVGQEVLGEVLARTSVRAPEETSRTEIAVGNPAARRSVDQRPIPQGTVSKAVNALIEVGLLEQGEKLLLSPDGRLLSPLRLGRTYVIAGAKIVQAQDRPREVTTALLQLGHSGVLGVAHDAAESWDQAAEVIHRHVMSLMATSNKERSSRGLTPLLLFGVGVVVAAPVLDGELMRFSPDRPRPSIPLADKLRLLFESDARFDYATPIILENDCNALAVLAIHQIHYSDADLVVVSVSEEGVRGGLVMDGRLRRGAYGGAMEIGHLAVGFPPHADLELQEKQAANGEAGSGFSARCSCGHFGHVDTLATPNRILEEFGDSRLDQMCNLDAQDPRFERARRIFARSGSALGRTLAHVINTVNPSTVIVYLPAPLADFRPNTAAAAYLHAARAEAANVFAASHQSDYLKIRPFFPKPYEYELLGAVAAGACVLESFIEHALRLDGCSVGLRRRAVGHNSTIKSSGADSK